MPDKPHQLNRLFGVSHHAEYQITHACGLMQAILVVKHDGCPAV